MTPLRPDELHEAARAVGYELDMLDASLRILIAVINHPEHYPPQPETRNAWLETYLLHARNLVEFYRSTGTRDDDLTAKHFVDGWTQATGGPALARLVKFAPDMNKRLAHLTTRRIRPQFNSIEWPLGEIHDLLGTVWDLFSDRVPSALRGSFGATRSKGVYFGDTVSSSTSGQWATMATGGWGQAGDYAGPRDRVRWASPAGRDEPTP